MERRDGKWNAPHQRAERERQGPAEDPHPPPQLDAVIVFTGSAYNNEHTPPNTIMEELPLPALLGERR
jgi:hypothetical protein